MADAQDTQPLRLLPSTVPTPERQHLVLEELDFNLDDLGASVTQNTVIAQPNQRLDEDVSLEVPLPGALRWAISTQPPRPWAGDEATQPLKSERTATGVARRVLVVSANEEERVYLRTRLALAKLVWVDEALTTTQALECMAAHPYLLGVFSLDDAVIDGWALAEQFAQHNPKAARVALSEQAQARGWRPSAHWRAWQLGRRAQAVGLTSLLPKPLEPPQLALVLNRVYQDRSNQLNPRNR